MLNILREAAKEVSNVDLSPAVREFRPDKFFYRSPFVFKPLPSDYTEKFISWGQVIPGSWQLPFVNLLLELDVIDIVIGGTTMFLYAFISKEFSYAYHYVWPSAHDFFEDYFPVQRASTYLCLRLMVLGRYAGRFAIGGFVYSLIKKGAYTLIGDRCTPFRSSLIAGTIFAMTCAKNYNTTQRPVWRLINGLWTGLGMAYFESVLLSYNYAMLSQLSPSDMPFRIR